MKPHKPKSGGSGSAATWFGVLLLMAVLGAPIVWLWRWAFGLL